MNERLAGLLFVLGAALAEGFSHVAFKQAADHGQHADGPLRAIAAAMRQYKTLSWGIGCFVVQAVCWTLALKFLDVSLAYPASSVEFIAVVLLARLMLKEKVGGLRWAGVALIVAGTALVALS
jgi:drug/metabolite transporter (DMT)-like permease